MKKIIAIILSILTVISLFGGVTVSASDFDVEVADDYPISYKEAHDAAAYFPVFYLESSVFDYKFEVILPDGSRQLLKSEEEITDEDRKNVEYISYGEAYINFSELEDAKADKLSTVPVHIDLTISERTGYGDTFSVLYKEKVTVRKPLADSYIESITPKTNLPAYLYDGAESVDFDSTYFEIVYWDGNNKTILPERVSTEDKAYYTLDGIALDYDANHQQKRIYISYLDSSRFVEVEELRAFPFESIKIVECELNEDMPVKITYDILRKGSLQAERYVKTVNAYSGYLDIIDGYPVAYSTEGSKYTSTVVITLADTLEYSRTYEMQQQSLLQKLIAKIMMFFKMIFSAGIF